MVWRGPSRREHGPHGRAQLVTTVGVESRLSDGPPGCPSLRLPCGNDGPPQRHFSAVLAHVAAKHRIIAKHGDICVRVAAESQPSRSQIRGARASTSRMSSRSVVWSVTPTSRDRLAAWNRFDATAGAQLRAVTLLGRSMLELQDPCTEPGAIAGVQRWKTTCPATSVAITWPVSRSSIARR